MSIKPSLVRMGKIVQEANYRTDDALLSINSALKIFNQTLPVHVIKVIHEKAVEVVTLEYDSHLEIESDLLRESFTRTVAIIWILQTVAQSDENSYYDKFYAIYRRSIDFIKKDDLS